MTVIIDKNGIQHIVDHDACVRIDKGERFPLGDSVPLNILVGVYHQSLYHSKKEDPRHDSVCQRLEALEKQIGAFPPRTLYERQVVYRAENLKSYSKLIAEIEALQKKVKALEDQHQETNPPFMRIYVEKPIPQGSDPDMTGVRASPYEDVRKFRKPGE